MVRMARPPHLLTDSVARQYTRTIADIGPFPDINSLTKGPRMSGSPNGVYEIREPSIVPAVDIETDDNAASCETRKLHIGIDFGTSFSSAAFAWSEPDIGFLGTTQSVRFGSYYHFPTEVGVTDGGVIAFGFDVQKHVAGREMENGQVFRLIKMSLADPDEPRFFRDRALLKDLHKEHRRLLDSISGKQLTIVDGEMARFLVLQNMEDVIVEFLRCFWNQVKSFIPFMSDEDEIHNDAQFFENRSVVSLAVPAIWTHSMIDKVHLLAARAGIPNIHISSEPKCCAAKVAFCRVLDRMSKPPIQADNRPIESIRDAICTVVDVGCGTAVRYPL